MDPTTAPSDGQIAGNVYRIQVTDQTGAPITAPESGKVTVVLRGPADVVDATIEQFSGAGWQRLKSQPAGFGSSFIAIVTTFGDFALVTSGGAPASGPASQAPSGAAAPSVGAEASPSGPTSSGSGGIGSALPVIVVVAGLAMVIGVFVASRRSRPTNTTGSRRRTPPKRRR